MKRLLPSGLPVLSAAIAVCFLFSCYKPTPFVLPQPPVSPYVFPDSTSVKSFLGTRNAKLVYALTDNGPADIFYVDFNDSVPAPKVLLHPAAGSTFNADKPMISPDGGFVTYGLLAGNNIHGAYMQKLNATAEPVLIAGNGTRPHWFRDPATGALYIVYSTVFMTLSPTPLTPGVGATFKQQVDTANGGSITGMPLVQIAPYPMIGGISSDGNNLCTGYEAGCFYNLPNAKLIPIDTGIQMCNPSIDPDPDTTNRMMFLNFGGSVPQNLINPFEDDPTYPANSQGVLPMHSVLFVVDTTNTVKNFIPISLMGSGYSAWQCPQWSNKPDFAAALAASNDESASWDLVLLKNISSRGNEQKLIVTLGSGKMNTESTPFLWIGN